MHAPARTATLMARTATLILPCPFLSRVEFTSKSLDSMVTLCKMGFTAHAQTTSTSHLDTFLSRAPSAEQNVPQFVHRAF